MAGMLEDTLAKVADGVYVELKVELTAEPFWTGS